MNTKKNWFITGANRGLGLAIARTLLDAGHSVIATSRDPSGIVKALGVSAKLLVLKLDVTVAEQAEAAVKSAIASFGQIDVLVNNAGYGQLGWFENTSDEEIRKQFETNVFGTMNVTRAVLPQMRAKRSGHIITISSIAGLISTSGYSVYSASKFALEGWMEGLAVELHPLNIKATIVGPGFFNTDFLDSSSASYSTYGIEDYAAQVKDFIDYNQQMNHKQVGDANLFGDLLISLSEAAKVPLRFSAGSDAYYAALDKIQQLSQESEEWKSLSFASDTQV